MSSNIIPTLKAHYLLRKGQKLASKGMFYEAIEAFSKASVVRSDYDFVYLHKGLAHSNCNEYKDAVKSLEQAININPSSDIFWVFLGRIHFDYKNYASAISAFEHAIKIDSSYKPPHVFIGLCNLAVGKYNEEYTLIYENFGSRKLQGSLLKKLNVFLKINNDNFQCSLAESRLLLICESLLFKIKGVLPECELSGDVPQREIPFLKHALFICILRMFRLKSMADRAEGKNRVYHEDQVLIEHINCNCKIGNYEEALKGFSQLSEDIAESLPILQAQACIEYKSGHYKIAANIFQKLSTIDRNYYNYLYYSALCRIALQDQKCLFRSIRTLTPILSERLFYDPSPAVSTL